MANRPSNARRPRAGRAVDPRATIRIGIVADTHGLYDRAIEPHWTGIDEILHAGDIGGLSVLRRLKRLAPVTAVSGNVDGYESCGVARRRLLRRGGLTIALCHILYERGRMTRDVQAWLDRVQADVCIFGHSHKPALERYGNTWLVNPGSAGPKRFSLPRGIGILTIRRGKVTPKLISLPDRINAGGRLEPSAVRRTKGALR